MAADKEPDSDTQEGIQVLLEGASTTKDCPESNANFLSKFTYSWLSPLLLTGWKRPLENSDLKKPFASVEATELSYYLESEWEKLKASGEKDPSLTKILTNKLFNEFVIVGLMRFIADMCTVFSPFLLKLLVTFVQTSRDSPVPIDANSGYAYAVGLFILQEGSSLISNRFFQITTTRSVIVRGALYAIIYRKATKLSTFARINFNGGKVTNIISTDVNRIEQFLVTALSSYTAPIQVLAISILLIIVLGPSALVGIGLLILLGPLQKFLMTYLFKLRKTVAPITDKRVKNTQEILEGIRVIKYFNWEKPYLKQLQELRTNELALILKRSLVQAFVMMIAFSVPVLVSSFSFVVYGITNSLNPAILFASLAWFNQLRFPLMLLPRILAGYADFKIAMARISELMNAEEVHNYVESVSGVEYGVKIENGTFKWDVDQSSNVHDSAIKGKEDTASDEEAKIGEFSIQNIDITIPKGQLVAIVGPVGSGKSTVLQSLVGETRKIEGSVHISGSIGYAPQQAWIQNATVRENILFGRPYDEIRYRRVVNVCCLERDLEILPEGDSTDIGEKGINLSGGQKQRVNLARLCYFDPDIVLMDDPLSAVDAHVGTFLFDNCISGELKTKTRVLVTHQLQVLSKVDYIYVLKDGRIHEHGKYEELMKKKLDFSELIKNFGGEGNGEKMEVSPEIEALPETRLAKLGGLKNESHRELMSKEERTTGNVGKQVWMTYFNAAGGIWFIIGCFSIVTIVQGINVANNYWLVVWTNNTIPSLSQLEYVLVYLGFSIAAAISSYLFGVFMGYAGVRSGRNLHDDAFLRILFAPTSFYDSTPLGRIINRFSKDQDTIDNTLMDSFRMFLNTLFSTIATFILIIVATPLFIAPLVPAMAVYYTVLSVYRSNSRELKRIDSIARSPLFALLGETLAGLPTIRAYGEVDRFVNETNLRIENSVAPSYYQSSAIRWLSLRFELLGSLLLFFAATFGVISRNSSSFSGAILGLSLSYALQVTMALNWCARQFTETEIGMNAVERLHYYGHEIPIEAPSEIMETEPNSSWPEKGTLVFEEVDMRYLPDLPLVLQKVSFDIRSKEKLGIVGRTGSGKSSIIQAVYRFIEICGGKIYIDGIDISKIGLSALRSKISIIPQDPILFSGTVRRNLDPFSAYPDADVWDAIDRAQLKSKISQIGGLDGQIQEGGSNLSVGERQLLCLARALLCRTRILFMDEATANVDFESDAAIQKCIRTDFADCTVVTIAHRLNTVMDYDRILVLENGRILEHDSPSKLLEMQGTFYSMFQQGS